MSGITVGPPPSSGGGGGTTDQTARDSAAAAQATADAAAVATTTTAALALKAPLASPTLTGTPAAPTAAQGTSTTQVATTAMVQSEVTLLAPKASPTLTGNPVAPTQTAADNSTRIATTAYADTAVTAQRTRDISGLWLPTGGKVETFAARPWVSSATFNLVTGTLYLLALGQVLRAGETYTSISMRSNGAASVPTNWWFTLVDQATMLTLRSTPDQTTTAWAGTTTKTVNLSSTLTPAADTRAYVGVMMTATTPVTVRCTASMQFSDQAPVLTGTSTTGMTAPLADGASVTALTAFNTPWWMYVS